MSKPALSPESFLKEVAEQCGLDAATFKITEEEPGKVSLRGEHLYVQVISNVDGSHVLYGHGLDGPLKKWGGDWAKYEDTEPFKDWIGDLNLMIRESKLMRQFLNTAFINVSKVLKSLNGIHGSIDGYSA